MLQGKFFLKSWWQVTGSKDEHVEVKYSSFSGVHDRVLLIAVLDY